MPDGELGDFVLHIADSLDGNVNFTTPPITPTALESMGKDFNAAVAACVDGTPIDTAKKNALRDQVTATLDKIANYVEFTVGNDREKLLSSGFKLTKTDRTPAVPGTTSILAVTNVGTGRLGVDLAVAANAWAYIVEYTAQPNGPILTETFTDPHKIILSGLTSGTNYSIRVKVMGSNNQSSEWCEAVIHMAT
jgi:hypothetical protein